jgi:hypothetical protein
MIPVETTPGIRVGGIKENIEEVNSYLICLMHCKNLCKCHNVPLLSTKTKEEKRPNS